MSTIGLARVISDRADQTGIGASSEVAGRCAVYLELLARWNRRINLTSLPIDPPALHAIDRLILEPLGASTHLVEDDSRLIDVGSGGGSPGLPMKIAVPRLAVVLIESAGRKAAFLREAIRVLELEGVEVEQRRFAEFAVVERNQRTADAATVRAVRLDRALVRDIGRVLRARGRLFWFASRQELARVAAAGVMEAHPLPGGQGSCLGIRRF